LILKNAGKDYVVFEAMIGRQFRPTVYQWVTFLDH